MKLLINNSYDLDVFIDVDEKYQNDLCLLSSNDDYYKYYGMSDSYSIYHFFNHFIEDIISNHIELKLISRDELNSKFSFDIEDEDDMRFLSTDDEFNEYLEINNNEYYTHLPSLQLQLNDYLNNGFDLDYLIQFCISNNYSLDNDKVLSGIYNDGVGDELLKKYNRKFKIEEILNQS